MPGPALLIKLSTAPGQTFTGGARLGMTGVGLNLQPLFSIPAAGPSMSGLAATQPQTWYRAVSASPGALTAAAANPWDAAHAALREGLGITGTNILAAEPDLEQGWNLPSPLQGTALAAADPNQPANQKGPPFDLGDGFGWHLDDAHSGLRAARDKVGVAAGRITVVHLDTGYDPGHVALPVNLAGADRQRNFVDAGFPNSAIDRSPTSGVLINRGHGTGTLGILAGGGTAGLRADPAIPANFGQLGGAPLAQIVPVRIANSVVHFWTSTVAQGIDYARQIGADVLSMSMGGLPAASWADAVNLAYEAGVVLVCAAGNSINGLPTSLVVYPARFDRVIAACGVMARGNPYYGLGNVMEGCAGPPSKMATAIAAYTPNIPWLKLGVPDVVDMDGAGTSAATPQVAAAAALWLAEHGDKYPRSWQRVEAVRAALFGSADRRGRTGDDPDPHFGRGLLRARAALDIEPDRASLRQTERDSGSFAFLHLISSVFGATAPDPRQLAMFRLELTQLALTTRAAATAVPDPDAPQIGDPAQRRMLEAILEEAAPSVALRGFLQGLLGQQISAAIPPAGPPHAPQAWKARPPVAPPGAAPAVAAALNRPINGRDIKRLRAIPKPAKRRLRVFATDPGDSKSLRRSFVNVAAVDVPWEDVKPGPVGEYLEVIDVDPASGAAYPPVDLNDRHLLAQDGIAPSEGNPQFHQQMVYAVAMRTIRNFEIALGRRALWAERLILTDKGHVPPPEGAYVQRLRIYPHALREQNAFYSPDRKALLFGYFDDNKGPSRGRRTILPASPTTSSRTRPPTRCWTGCTGASRNQPTRTCWPSTRRLRTSSRSSSTSPSPNCCATN